MYKKDNSNSSPVFIAMAPIYLLQVPDRCYRCDAQADVSCLAITGIGEYEAFMRTRHLSFVSSEIDVLLKHFAPQFYLDKSGDIKDICYVNHCPSCGAVIPDTIIHSSADGPFVPHSEELAEIVTMRTLSHSNNIRIASGYTASWCDELILEYAYRVPSQTQSMYTRS